MNALSSLEEIFDITSKIRDKKRGFITNFYLEELRHSIWIKKKNFYYEWNGDTCFLFRKTEHYWNAFYLSTSTEELGRALSELNQKYSNASLIFDIVGRQETCDVLMPVFQANGFFQESSLARYIRINNAPIENDLEIKKVQRATIEQAREANRLLHQYMDERIEQIPDIEEYEEWAKLGHILVYLVDDKIAGFFDYEKNKSTTMTRHWLVLPEYRGHHIGATLYHRFLYEANDTKRILSWIIQSNEISIKNHVHYGFKRENLFDYIMTNEKTANKS